MIILYPDIRPYSQHRIDVEAPHELYVEECGNRDGIPVLFVHGGPGAGCEKYHRRFFNPELYRIILFDQRGSGRSTPHAELKNNTTQHLLKDIETIREYLSVDKWALFGGSWGSTLSLLYAEKYPERVLGMILRGIFLCRDKDLKWFYTPGGASEIFPDAWQELVDCIPESERDDLITAFHNRLSGSDEIARMAAAKHWAAWEGHCSTLRPSHNVLDHYTDPHVATSLARIECQYFMNKGYLEENQILNDAAKIKDIPGIIVHGRYDMICPLDNAFALHRAWPASELHIVRDAGHASSEPGIVDALVRATDDLAKSLEAEGY
ncbi:MAG: prolyl aminopeptidase [Moraxellaceae bacterium]|nr:MAG: prolyl aminopeptidase [Moraxellaceae bacterium]